MYLRNLHIRNVGPIEKLDIEFELQTNLNPKPIILVGKNGSGKTGRVKLEVRHKPPN